jgi:hypothetical protein
LARASYLLAKSFGWTPLQLQDMTMAQIAFYSKMIEEDNKQ